MDDMDAKLPRLPMARVLVMENWHGSRSLFHKSWTGLAFDRVCVYHRAAAEENGDCWIETTTFPSGGWLDVAAVDFMLTQRASAVGDLTVSEARIRVDGVAKSFDVIRRGRTWGALSRVTEQPVVTLLAECLSVEGISLKTMAVAEIDGHERFGPG